MKLRGFTALAALIACCLAPSAGGQVGNGRIAFVHEGDVWSVAPDGSGLANLTGGRAGAVSGPVVWSPNGARLAFEGNGPSGDVFLIGPYGSGLRELPLSGSPACWLGDARIVVVRDFPHDPGYSSVQDLYVASADGTDVRRLTTDGGRKRVSTQSCARDGTKVVYSRGGAYERDEIAYLISPDGGPPTQLTPPTLKDSWPTLSPSGDLIAVARWVPGGVDVVDLRGQVVTIPSGGPPPASAPLWSPDGRNLLYETSVFVGQFETAGRVHVAAANGTGERDLTPFEPPGLLQPQWSPDGARIAFLSNRSRSSNLWLANIDGTCPTPLGATVTGGFSWQPAAGGPVAPSIRCADLSFDEPISLVRSAIGTEDITFLDLFVRNIGNLTATGNSIAFTIVPDGLVVDRLNVSDGSCDAQTLTCTFRDLQPGDVALVAMGVKAAGPLDFSGTDAPTPVRVMATVASDQAELDRSNNEVVATTNAYPCTYVSWTFAGDVLAGTDERDVLCGFGGNDSLVGRGNSDTLVAGAGADFLDGGPGRDLLLADEGDDTILASDGETDRIDCGAGSDLAVVDRSDQVANCESVVYPRVRCETITLDDNNKLIGTPGDDHLCGLDGNDTLEGLGGSDSLDGGPGNDTIDGGPGQDTLFGNLGHDVILARDGERDSIDCGKNYDTAIVDRFDRVARNCEHVLRSR